MAKLHISENAVSDLRKRRNAKEMNKGEEVKENDHVKPQIEVEEETSLELLGEKQDTLTDDRGTPATPDDDLSEKQDLDT
jgi:hypothetical protein